MDVLVSMISAMSNDDLWVLTAEIRVFGSYEGSSVFDFWQEVARLVDREKEKRGLTYAKEQKNT